MNLKDRLENIRTTNVLEIKGNEENIIGFDVEQVFLDSDDVKRILIQAIDEGKNILFSSNPSMDVSLLIKYFTQLLASKEADIVFPKNLFDEVLGYENRINIIPSPSINELVAVLEKIMYGYKSFLFGLKFSNSNYLLEKIKTAISLNFKNLSVENIEILLGSSDLIFVNFDKNSDGLYYVSKIEKVIFENYKTDTLTLFDSNPKLKKEEHQEVEKKQEESVLLEEKNEQVVEQPAEVVDVLSDEQVLEENKTEQVQELEMVEEKPADVSVEDVEKTESSKKINKYTKLKEKVKRKKASTQE